MADPLVCTRMKEWLYVMVNLYYICTYYGIYRSMNDLNLDKCLISKVISKPDTNRWNKTVQEK